MKKLLVLSLGLVLSSCFLQAQNDTMYVMKAGVVVGKYNVNTQVDSVIFYKPNTNTNPNHDLNDFWLASDGYGVKISGTYGVFYSFSSIWQEVANAGLVSIGSESFRSITQNDELNWTYENLWWLKSNNVYSIIWSPGSTINMNIDGQSITVTSINPTDPNDVRTKTFARDTHKSVHVSFKAETVKNRNSGY